MRRGPLSVTMLLSEPSASVSAPPSAAVAWAIPRRVGTAVVRNRVRRRLRSLVADEHRQTPLPAGAYLFQVDPAAAHLSAASLSAAVHELLSAVRGSVTA